MARQSQTQKCSRDTNDKRQLQQNMPALVAVRAPLKRFCCPSTCMRRHPPHVKPSPKTDWSCGSPSSSVIFVRKKMAEYSRWNSSVDSASSRPSRPSGMAPPPATCLRIGSTNLSCTQENGATYDPRHCHHRQYKQWQVQATIITTKPAAFCVLTMSITAALKYDVETCLAASFTSPSAHFALRRTSSNVTVGDQGGLARENMFRWVLLIPL